MTDTTYKTPEAINEFAEEVYVFPTSFAQQRLWFLEQLMPENPFYNVAFATRLRGSLDAMALQRSLNEIVRRHEALRTTFNVLSGEPVQVVAPRLTLEMPFIDLQQLSEADRQAEALRMATAEQQHPFALSKGPLLRATLLRLAAAEHMLLLTMHHIISDGWSLEVLMRELKVLYAAFSKQQDSPLAELPIQYADFAIWQREWLQGEVLERQLSYWKQQLSGFISLKLPTDRTHPEVQNFRGDHHLRKFSSVLKNRLKALSQQEGTTLFMTLLAAFKVLLQRYSGQKDISVGTPIANRNRAEIEGLIGFFVNTLVLRTEVSGELTFRQLLARVRETALGAYGHQDLPFEKLVEELQPERDLSRTPLFQVSFSLREDLLPEMELAGLEVVRVDNGIKRTRFDLEIHVVDSPEGLLSDFVYSVDLFDKETIERMGGHFERLLEGIVANPDQRICELPLLTAAEEQQLLVEWNETATEYPRWSTIPELFEAQVEARPQALAVVCGERELSYEELNRRANQLAHYLRARGVGRESLVGVCLERSVEMVVALLGILKAGGAYVPLDLSYPQERLTFMLEDAGVKVLVTERAQLGQLPALAVETICVDRDRELVGQESEAELSVDSGAEDLAYVMYTSGSTGEPKGVAVPQRAVVRLVTQTNYIELGKEARMAQVSNCSFDAATFEIWGALLNGAVLLILSREVTLSPAAFAHQLKAEKISVMFLTTALFNQLAREVPGVFSSLKDVLVGGEACDPCAVREVLAYGPPQRLLNVYGPTENTTFSTWQLIEDVAADATTIPIGRPLANTEVYILDANLRSVPIGVAGEIYLSGDGLAREYLNRPELTAERFIANPFSADPEARLYKTGDEACYLADGRIEFLGRKDQQVKLRGYRIELGEVEAVLGRHEAVRAAVVEAVGSGIEKRLVAYVVGEGPVSEGELRQWLRERLPEYMTPAQFVMLEELPLTPNGKVDRRALPFPEHSGNGSGAVFVAPETELEQMIAEAWQEELHIERVGKHDNFFDLGGHSLLMTKIHRKLHNAVDREIRIIDMFKYPTIGSLATYLAQSSQPSSSLTGIKQRVKKQREMAGRRIRIVKHQHSRRQR